MIRTLYVSDQARVFIADLPLDEVIAIGQSLKDESIIVLNARHADDPRPLDELCKCPACTDFSRAYMHHLTKANEILGPMLLTWHNIQYYQDLMGSLRRSISDKTLGSFIQRFNNDKLLGDIEPL